MSLLEDMVLIGIHEFKQPVDWSMTFVDNDGSELGKLTIVDGKLHFEGEADESAMVFFKAIMEKTL
jgi:hypothetical protein